MSIYDKLFNRKMKQITKKGIQNMPAIMEEYPYTKNDIATLRMGRNIQLKKKKVAKSMIIKELENQSKQFWRVLGEVRAALINGNHGDVMFPLTDDRKMSKFVYSPNRANGICWFRDYYLNNAFINAGISLDKLDEDIFHEEMRRMIEETFFGFFNRLEGDLAGYKKGESGEEYVEKQMSILSDKYFVRQNVLLPSADELSQTSETDAYIVTAKGIFVCEVKNWGGAGQTIKVTKDGQWSIIKSGAREAKESPVAQNSRHCLATEKYLKNKGIDKIRIKPLIIIANDMVFVENEGDNAIIRASEIYSYIEGLNLPEIYSEEEQKQIIELFEDCKIEERYFMINDYVGTMKESYGAYIKELLKYKETKDAYIKKIADYSNVILDELTKEWEKRNRKIRILRISIWTVAIISGISFVVYWWFRNYVWVILGAIAGFFCCGEKSKNAA